MLLRNCARTAMGDFWLNTGAQAHEHTHMHPGIMLSGLRGRCRTVRARCAHGACTVRARFNVFGMVAQLVPR